jgi:hypothetical protein
LYDIDHGIRRNGVAETLTVASHFAIDENHHMLADFTLLVEDIPARPGVVTKVIVEHSPQRGSRSSARRTLHMPLDILSESYSRHSKIWILAEPRKAFCD